MRRMLALALLLTGATLPLRMAAQASPAAHPSLASVAEELRSAAGPTQVVLVFADGRPGRAHRSALERLGVRVVAYEALPMAVTTLTPAGIAAARRLPGLRAIEPAGTAGRWLSDRTMPTVRAEQERAARARGLGYDGTGIGVAVLDTGVDGTHPDLHFPDHLVQNVVVRGDQATSTPYDTVPGVVPPTYVENVPDTDYLGHGTHTAGIAAANGTKYPGVAPGAKVISLAANENASVPYVLASFDYVLTHPQYNIKVVNCSFGVLKPYDPQAPINVAQKALHDKGIAVVWAAGNSGPAAGTTSAWTSSPYAISVGMGDPDGRLRGDSSRGWPADSRSWPTLVAPGDNLTVASAKLSVFGAGALGSDYETESGTSAAAPVVAGTVALMQQAAKARLHRYLSVDEVKQILTRTATPMGGYQPWEVGAGMVDAYAAVDAVVHGLSRYGVPAAAGAGARRTFAGASWSQPVMPPSQSTLSFHYTVVGHPARLDVLASWGMPEADWHLTVDGPKGAHQEMDRFPAGYLTGTVDALSFTAPQPGQWTVSLRLAQGELASRPDTMTVRLATTTLSPRGLPRGFGALSQPDAAAVAQAVAAGWVPADTRVCATVRTSELAAALARAATVRQVPGPAGWTGPGGAAAAPGAVLRTWYWGDAKRFPQRPLVTGRAHDLATRADLARAVVRALHSPGVAVPGGGEGVSQAGQLGVMALRGGEAMPPRLAADEPLTWVEVARALVRQVAEAAGDAGGHRQSPPAPEPAGC